MMASNKLIWILVALISVAGCGFDDDGGGTEAEGLTGTLVNPQGEPIKDALVKVYPITNGSINPDASIETSNKAYDSTYSDRRGIFVFKNLPKGPYNLEGLSHSENSILGVYVPNVNENDKLGTTVLMPAGSILIPVTFDGGQLEGAQCYVPGSSFIGYSDDQGLCSITGIPSSTYSVRVRYQDMVTVRIEGVSVQIGGETKLDTVELFIDVSLPPPTPREIHTEFDSTLGAVKISWSSVSVPDVAGYVLFRRDAASFTPERIFPQIVRDTFYVDTLAGGIGDSANFLYQVKAQDENANLSLVYSLASYVTVQYPAFPTQPFPVENSVTVPTTTILTWNGLGKKFVETDSYTVYLDTISPPIHKVAQNLTSPSYSLSGLRTGTKYFWKVTSHLSTREFSGPVWSFTTEP